MPLCEPALHKHGGEDCPKRGKRPIFKGWQKLTEPLADSQVEEHWGGPRAGRNVGISCHGLLVVDLDTLDSYDALRELFEAHGDILPSPTVATGGGGRHFYFRMPVGEQAPPNSAGRLGPGIDIRGEGGQVVAPPSVHESGRPYKWIDKIWLLPGAADHPEAPRWLLELLQRPGPPAAPASETDRAAAAEETGQAAPPGGPDRGAATLVGEHLARVRAAPEGERNDTLNRAAFCFGRLEAAGRIDADGVRGELWEACAGYRADDGDQAARGTIDSGWQSGLAEGPLELPAGAAPAGPAEGDEGPAKGESNTLGLYSFVSPVATGMEPLCDAARLLEARAGQLLAVTTTGKKGEQETVVYVATPAGLWVNDPALLASWHCEASNAWEKRAIAAANEHDWGKQHERAIGVYGRRARTPQGVHYCLVQLPVLIKNRESVGLLPPELTRCDAGDLDGLRYLGAPNGVVDLQTGRLLPPEEGRLALVTKSLPDEFDPGATNPDVDKLAAHLPRHEAEWLWRMLAYALHGRPARTFVLCVGPAGGGKSTITRACLRSLGSYALTLAPGAIAPRGGTQGANAPTPDMESMMPPTRLVFGPEAEDQAIRTARLKALAGADELPWRRLFEGPQAGVPSASIWLFSNTVPKELKLQDPALLKRLRAVHYPPVPEEDIVPGLIDAWDDISDGSRERRQALVAKLVGLAKGLTPGEPPEPTRAVKQAIGDLYVESIGPVGEWLRDNVVPVKEGEPDHGLLFNDLWEALKAEFPPPDGIDTADPNHVEGHSKQAVSKLVQDVCGAPPSTHVKPPGRKRGRGWKGFKLRGKPTGDEQETSEPAAPAGLLED